MTPERLLQAINAVLIELDHDKFKLLTWKAIPNSLSSEFINVISKRNLTYTSNSDNSATYLSHPTNTISDVNKAIKYLCSKLGIPSDNMFYRIDGEEAQLHILHLEELIKNQLVVERVNTIKPPKLLNLVSTDNFMFEMVREKAEKHIFLINNNPNHSTINPIIRVNKNNHIIFSYVYYEKIIHADTHIVTKPSEGLYKYGQRRNQAIEIINHSISKIINPALLGTIRQSAKAKSIFTPPPATNSEKEEVAEVSTLQMKR